MIKPERTKIPKEKLSNGIDLCVKNSERFKEEGREYEKKKNYQSAIISITLGLEELSKAVILLAHHKQKKDISKEKSDKIFSNHKYRLKIIRQFIDANVIPELDLNTLFMKKLHENQADEMQCRKMQMIYVDWIEDWHDPKTKDSNDLKNYYDHLENQYTHAHGVIYCDGDYQEMMK